jgi:hypothetical protein
MTCVLKSRIWSILDDGPTNFGNLSVGRWPSRNLNVPFIVKGAPVFFQTEGPPLEVRRALARISQAMLQFKLFVPCI